MEPQDDPKPTDLLTATEAAEALNVSIKSVRKWSDDGKLPSVRTPGGHRRFRRSDLEATGLVPGVPAEPTPAA